VKALRLAWLGIRTDDYDANVAFFRDLLGFEVVFEEERTIELELPAGERVQLFAPGHEYHGRFAGAGPVPLFEVDDLEAVERRLHDASVETLGRAADAEWEWLEVRGPDGNLYSLGARRG
jgi:catechol 2,3-dioxygenase-like lactoylglutathione lyase family enzyme